MQTEQEKEQEKQGSNDQAVLPATKDNEENENSTDANKACCPICKDAMTLKVKDISHGKDPAVEYDRSIYHCPKHDVWVTAEIPRVS